MFIAQLLDCDRCLLVMLFVIADFPGLMLFSEKVESRLVPYVSQKWFLLVKLICGQIQGATTSKTFCGNNHQHLCHYFYSETDPLVRSNKKSF